MSQENSLDQIPNAEKSSIESTFDSDFTPRLNAALAKAQGMFSVPIKNRIADVKSKEGKLLYKFKYADLASIHEATRQGLAENGLSHTHRFVPMNPPYFSIITTLRHESGEIIKSELPFEISDRPQSTAAVISYWRRYALGALLGVASEEDTDGGVDSEKQGTYTDNVPNATPPAGDSKKTGPAAPSSGDHRVGLNIKDGVVTSVGFKPNPKKVTVSELVERKHGSVLQNALKRDHERMSAPVPPDDFDQRPQFDDFPTVDNSGDDVEKQPETMLDKLFRIKLEKKLTSEKLKQIIHLSTGKSPDAARDLSSADLDKVIDYLEKFI
jgi:hypothetical protein